MATANATAFPLPLRNALAELVISALEADDALAALAWLAEPATTPDTGAARRLGGAHLVDDAGILLDVHRPFVDAVRGHAARGRRAAAAYRSRPAMRASPTEHAVVRAAALWDEALFFEVHEVLEAVWKTAAGPVRQALQGLIQIAVAFHHLRHGNPRGARTLMREGRERLGGACGALPRLDAGVLLAATAPWEEALARGASPSDPAPPRLPLGA